VGFGRPHQTSEEALEKEGSMTRADRLKKYEEQRKLLINDPAFKAKTKLFEDLNRKIEYIWDLDERDRKKAAITKGKCSYCMSRKAVKNGKCMRCYYSTK
jgi:hypothetical protein